jgi:hypothetical protein
MSPLPFHCLARFKHWSNVVGILRRFKKQARSLGNANLRMSGIQEICKAMPLMTKAVKKVYVHASGCGKLNY